MSDRLRNAPNDIAAPVAQGKDALWAQLKDAWVNLAGPKGSNLHEIVHKHVALEADRKSYRAALEDGLREHVQHTFLQIPTDGFDLYAFEYQSLYARIMGEGPLPDAMLFLFRDQEQVSDEQYQGVRDSMFFAYGQELAYLSLMPKRFPWFQVVYTVDAPAEVDRTGVTIALDPNLFPAGGKDRVRWQNGSFNDGERANIRGILREAAHRELFDARSKGSATNLETATNLELDQLADMISATPFMTVARIAQKWENRSVLYFPAYLHGDRVGGGVLMGNRVVSDENLIEALRISNQMLLVNLRLLEFPEEVQRAEREVLQRQLVRRFRHNLMHPLGNLIDATNQFKDSFESMMVLFEKGIESWKPDIMPNYVKKFVDYIAGQYREEPDVVAKVPEPWGSGAGETSRFSVSVEGTEHVDRFDRIILAEVLQNLFTNTRRYAAPRSGFVGVRLDVGEKADAPIIYEEIGGPGLPPEIAADPWRLHRRDASLESSSGQGLFMAKRLMEIHGGDIKYEPSASGGCRFDILLRKED